MNYEANRIQHSPKGAFEIGHRGETTMTGHQLLDGEAFDPSMVGVIGNDR